MKNVLALTGLLVIIICCFFASPKQAYTAAAATQDGPAVPQSASQPNPPQSRRSLVLDGSGAFVDVPNSESLNITGPLTVEAWIKTNAATAQSVVERYRWASSQDGGFALRLTAEGKLQFGTIKNSSENDFITGNTTLSAGTWHHVAGIFDGGQLRLYVDGMLDGSKNSSLVPASGTANLKIGVNAVSNTNYFNGLIDEVRLTAGARYQTNFTPEKSLNAGGIILGGGGVGARGVWNFNDETASDFSGYNNHGTLVGNLSFSAEYATPAVEPASTATATTTTINFDELSYGVDVSNHYPQIRFSSKPGLSVYSFNAPGNLLTGPGDTPQSLPNTVTRGYYSGLFFKPDHFADFVADFPQPVNNLKFYITSCDDYLTIALLDVYQNGVKTRTLPVPGNGPSHAPILADFQQGGINNVTKVVVYNITDRAGLTFDSFSFDVVPGPTPTPTPAPTPTPTPGIPSPPTNLDAVVDDTKVRLSWTASPSAQGYNVSRTTVNNNSPSIPSSSGTASPMFFSDTTVYIDVNVTEAETYSYTVTAVNSAGESPPSAPKVVAIPACGNDFIPKPAPTVYDMIIDNKVQWHVPVEVTPNDGVAVYDVSLNGRYMAKRISVPYFLVQTNKMAGLGLDAIRGELMPNNTTTLRSRLVKFEEKPDLQGRIHILADYLIDKLTPTSTSCLTITQEYIFEPTGLSGGCEPGNTFPCNKFNPSVTYKFNGRNGETLEYIYIAQRNQYAVDSVFPNTVGLFKDCDVSPSRCFSIPNQTGVIFVDKKNPLEFERYESRMIDQGEPASNQRGWDNIHQTDEQDLVLEPGDPDLMVQLGRLKPGGCPECVHMHWRWGAYLGPGWGGKGNIPGEPRIGSSSRQNLDFAVVLYKLSEELNEPFDFRTLAGAAGEDGERIHETKVTEEGIAPKEVKINVEYIAQPVVVWYGAYAHPAPGAPLIQDTFFNFDHFFGPNRLVRRRTLSQTSSTQPAAAEAGGDAPISVTADALYQDGSTTFSVVAGSSLSTLPRGYTLYNGDAFDIKTDALESGKDLVVFGVPSATDQSVFSSLRILHAEADPFDPAATVWVDSTVLAPDTNGPDFNSKTIQSKTKGLGRFVIASFTPPQSVGQADLALTITDSQDPVTSGRSLTYNLRATNNGPADATDVGIIDGIDADANFVSTTSSQGSCKHLDGSVYCKLGTIANGAAATVTITVETTDSKAAAFPLGWKVINTALIASNVEADPSVGNNSATEYTSVTPDPNPAPTVDLTTPTFGQMLTGPASITLSATASDSNGSVSKVDFYDNGTLIGTDATAGASQFHYQWNNVDFGPHTLIAVATDNQGRPGVSKQVGIIVNGPATVSIVSPAPNASFTPSTNIQLLASAFNSSGTVAKVEFFADGARIGQGTDAGGGTYIVTWSNVPSGIHSLTAVATDGSNRATTSAAVNIKVNYPPSVNIVTPSGGDTSFPAAPARVEIVAEATDNDSPALGVKFYANGTFIGEGTLSGVNRYSFSWRDVPGGFYSVTAVATDSVGDTTASPAVDIAVNRVSVGPGDFVWLDDAIPQGAAARSDNDEWRWTNANPAPLLGTLGHQSKLSAGYHRHYFDGTADPLHVSSGDRLYTYVFLDPNNMPQEIMLQWFDGSSWEHRAYWGANLIQQGTEGTESLRYLGSLPHSAQWVRLEVDAASVGLAGKTVSGMSFDLYDGRATWDRAGMFTQSAPPSPARSAEEFVWVDDAMPDGATVNPAGDPWVWGSNPAAFSGQRVHYSFVTDQLTAHGFLNASARMQVDPGDTLFAYVYLDPQNKPDELILRWIDERGQDHRAYWGQNYYTQGSTGTNAGVTGTESRRFMGAMPPVAQWVRLEVPASYVGLEGKVVTGMSFGSYRNAGSPKAFWDRSGKAAFSTTTPIRWTNLTRLWRLQGKQSWGKYYFLSTNDIGSADQGVETWFQAYIFAAQTAGTVPLYRYRENGDKRYFYIANGNYCAKNPTCSWVLDNSDGSGGVVGYIYPPADNAPVPGTVPLYGLWRDGYGYFYTTNPSELPGLSGQYQVGWVYPNNPLVPSTPSGLVYVSMKNYLYWRDNSTDESGFKIEQQVKGGRWAQIATVGENVNYLSLSNLTPAENSAPETQGPLGGGTSQTYRVKAYNGVGESDYSNVTILKTLSGVTSAAEGDGEPPPNTAPEASIVSPANGDIVGHNFVIRARAFDAEGYGTLGKAEFFANGMKIGEASQAPYNLSWQDVPDGSYTLIVKVTDSYGVTATSSAAVNITVIDTTLVVPTNLVATATSATQVSLTWAAPSSGGAVDHYVIERAQSLAGPFSPVASPPASPYADATAAPDTAYLYRVKAVFAGGAESPYSDPDLATTVVFTGDDEIVPGAVIRASQLVKLRRAVGAVRTLVGLPAYGWTNADPVSMPASQRRPIYVEDVTDLRSALEGPLTTLGRSQAYPAVPALARGAVIYADHFAQIKSRVE